MTVLPKRIRNHKNPDELSVKDQKTIVENTSDIDFIIYFLENAKLHDEVQEFCIKEYSEYNIYLAKNKNLSPNIQATLYRKAGFDSSLMDILSFNENLDEDIQYKMISDIKITSHVALVTRSEKVQLRLISHHFDDKVALRSLVQNKNLSDRSVNLLIRKLDKWSTTYYADNYDLCLLLKYYQIPDKIKSTFIAKYVVKYKNDKIIEAICKNPNTDIDTLNKILNNRYIRMEHLNSMCRESLPQEIKSRIVDTIGRLQNSRS